MNNKKTLKLKLAAAKSLETNTFLIKNSIIVIAKIKN